MARDSYLTIQGEAHKVPGVSFDQGNVGNTPTDVPLEDAAVAAEGDEQAFARGKRNCHPLAFVLPHLRPGELYNRVQAGPETGGQEGADHPAQQATRLLGDAAGRVERGLVRRLVRKPQMRC